MFTGIYRSVARRLLTILNDCRHSVCALPFSGPLVFILWMNIAAALLAGAHPGDRILDNLVNGILAALAILMTSIVMKTTPEIAEYFDRNALKEPSGFRVPTARRLRLLPDSVVPRSGSSRRRRHRHRLAEAAARSRPARFSVSVGVT